MIGKRSRNLFVALGKVVNETSEGRKRRLTEGRINDRLRTEGRLFIMFP